MRSLLDPHARAELFRRFDSLTPDRPPRWGRMTAPEMIGHLITATRQGLGETDFGPPKGPFRRWPMNWLVIHVMPWPKGKAQSPREFLGRTPEAWDGDLRTLRELAERFAARPTTTEWPRSLVFGKISPKSWGVLMWKHFDHHLRQFGA